MSVLSTKPAFASLRLRLALLEDIRWRREALERRIFPVPVTLNRFDTAFFVLLLAIGLGIKGRQCSRPLRPGNQKIRGSERGNGAPSEV